MMQNGDDTLLKCVHECDFFFFFTFNFEVVSSKAVSLEVEGERRVGLIQEQVDAG